MPCFYFAMTPAYSKEIMGLRLKAQKNLMQAFEETGSRCIFVPGATQEPGAANQGNKEFFNLSSTRMV